MAIGGSATTDWRQAAAEDEVESAWSEWSRTVDHTAIGAAMVLFAIGVVLAFAASPALAERNGLPPFHYAWRHMLFGAPCFALILFFSFFSVSGVRRVGAVIAILGVAALALLPAYGLSHGKEATRWFSIAGFSVQPSEFAKPGVVVACAWMLSALSCEERNLRVGGLAAAGATLTMVIGLLILQPDYGQAALLLAVWSAMYFAAGGSIGVVAACAGAGLAIGWAAYHLEPHIATRVDAFLDPAGSGQTQLRIAAEAIANGGWFGKGLGEGVAKDDLPDAHSDFILAVAAEEYGFALVVVMVAIYMALPLRALWRLRDQADPFAHTAGVGLAALFGMQALVHIAVVAQLAPATGMTLPMVSYGGSSMLATGLGFGLLMALTRREPDRG